MFKAININNLIIFSFAFILFTAIGTISHEYGHILVAKLLGYDTTLHHASMNYDTSVLNDSLITIYTENQAAIESDTDFYRKDEYDRMTKKLTQDSFYVTIGGPLQTILTGLIGLCIIFYRRKKMKADGLALLDWFAIFLALFWLRQVFNVVQSISREIISPNGSYFSGDEKNISAILNLWSGTVSILLGTIGLLVSIYIIFRIIPIRFRYTFILGGLFGGILGFYLWINIVGPVLIP